MNEPRDLHKNVIRVIDLLNQPNLSIPTYQRPYKWTTRNINQLFSDISAHTYSNKKTYRLGTIVFHIEGDNLNIVDGQQRTITLLLAGHALISKNSDDIKRQDLRADLAKLKPHLEATMQRLEFANEFSIKNINNNYLEISRLISRPEFTEDHAHYLLNQCELITFVLEDISEAFQFFDSQNARGRDLEPHDLLKAFHLREFADEDENLKARTVARWEDTPSEELNALFADKLYRIRNWSRGISARYFSKEDVGLFKGVNLSVSAPYPFTEQLRITHHFIDHHRSQYERRIDREALGYPFQLDQIIINGRRFFEMVDHYMDKIDGLTKKKDAPYAHQPLDGMAKTIRDTIDTYKNRHRTGDRYVRTVFDCLLIYYFDKFGSADLSRAIEKIFIWSYTIRLKMSSVQLATVDNYVLRENNLFMRLKEAIHPNDFTLISLPVVADVSRNAPGAIKELFQMMNYLKS